LPQVASCINPVSIPNHLGAAGSQLGKPLLSGVRLGDIRLPRISIAGVGLRLVGRSMRLKPGTSRSIGSWTSPTRR
jgi:hypothetical protein